MRIEKLIFPLLLPTLVTCLVPAGLTAQAEKTRIDVMVVYTPAVTANRNGHDQVYAHILNSVALSNVALENSDIPLYLNLVHAEEIDYVESNSMSTDLGRLRGSTDGYMDEVHGWRNSHGADLVALMRRGSAGNVAGIAYMLSNTNGSPGWAFSVVSDSSSAASLLMGHEFGHNFGAAHDRDNTTAGGIFSDSYGHRFNGDNGVTYRTVMAYTPGTRVAHFSNPDISVAGTPTGHPATHPEAAHNARTLRQMRSVLAGYRAQVYPGPDATFNGTHSLVAQQRSFDDGFMIAHGRGAEGSVRLENSTFTTTSGFRLGQGDNARATLTLVNSTVNSSGSNALLAARPGSRATVNISPNSILNFSSGNTYDRIGYNGTALIGIAAGGTMNTRHAVLADNPGSAATITLHGEGALWNHNSWYVDMGRRGRAEVNVLNGALMSGVQRLHVGGSLLDIDEQSGIGILNVAGENSRVTFAAGSNLSFLAIGRQGHGTVNITGGGSLTVASNSTGTGYIQLAEMAGDTGTLTVSSGGSASTTSHLRAGISGAAGQIPAAEAGIDVRGNGSLLFVESYVHLGFAGRGELLIESGGEMITASNFFIGRSTGRGAANVSGAGSRLAIGDRLHLSADPSRNPTNGSGLLLVDEDGLVTVTNDVVARAGGEIELRSGGTLQMGGAIDLGPDATLLLEGGRLVLAQPFDVTTAGFEWQSGILQTGAAVTGLEHVPANSSLILAGPAAVASASSGNIIVLGANASVLGTGSLSSRLHLGSDGSGMAFGESDPDALLLQAGVTGNGSLNTLTVGGEIAPGDGAGRIEMHQVRFGTGASLTLQVRGTGTHDVLVFDSQTDFTNLTAAVEFVDFAPASQETFRLFEYVGDGSAAFNFASLQTPEGWRLEDGVLISTSPAQGITAWAESYSLFGDDALPNADPDGDGFTNIEEFAFGTDPTSPTKSLVQLAREGQDFLIRWNRQTAEGIGYAIERSASLAPGSWIALSTPVAVVMVIPDQIPPPGYERVELAVPIDEAERKAFYRIRADVPPHLLSQEVGEPE